MSDGDEALRKAAKKRLKAQSDLKRIARIFGMSIALAFMGYAGYGPRERVLSQGEIDAEMRRFRGEPPG